MNALPNFSMRAFLKLGSVTETSKYQASFFSMISSASFKEINDSRIMLYLPKLGPFIDESLLIGEISRITALPSMKLSLFIGIGLSILFLNLL
jgi:hypothetical protein